MNDIYKIGFWVILSFLVGFVGLAAIVTFLVAGDIAVAGYISLFSGILGGVGGFVTAVVAVVGVKAWRDQLFNGRKIQAIWDAQISLRKYLLVVREVNMYMICAAKVGSDKFYSDSLHGQMETALTAQREYIHKCMVVDRVVVRKGWGWSEKAMAISMDWIKHCEKYNSYEPDVRSVNTAKNWESVGAAFEAAEDELDSLLDRIS